MTANDLVTPSQTHVPRGAHIADPGPLGLASFSLTTLILSCYNAGLFEAEPVVFGLALAYGGIAQFAAGMWEYTKGNTFGATAFASYGAFWVAFWYLTGFTDMSEVPAEAVPAGIGLFLVAWGIFTVVMTIGATRTTKALCTVFVLLTITFFLLAAGDFTGMKIFTRLGGVTGILTAIAGWYNTLAGVTAFTHGKSIVPVWPVQRRD